MADPNRQVNVNGLEKVEAPLTTISSTENSNTRKSLSDTHNNQNQTSSSGATIESIVSESGQTKRVLKFPVVRFASTIATTKPDQQQQDESASNINNNDNGENRRYI